MLQLPPPARLMSLLLLLLLLVLPANCLPQKSQPPGVSANNWAHSLPTVCMCSLLQAPAVSIIDMTGSLSSSSILPPRPSSSLTWFLREKA
ncbi:hypothetical protein CGMCC3_g7002 [Colletotrichum fructicola]|nr:uncharacterized protein CGMCC3_g7002 [Colletotrichum fructicola]KAE9577058.1 hypothetical protein CGMCC3_g7002 [Colletotrichum fructicola]